MPPLFVYFISHEKRANKGAGDMQYNWHLWFWCPTSNVSPRKTMLLYLGKPLWYDFLSHKKQINQKIPHVLTTVINSGVGAWAQSFLSRTQCFSKRDILFLHVLPICVYVLFPFMSLLSTWRETIWEENYKGKDNIHQTLKPYLAFLQPAMTEVQQTYSGLFNETN